MITHTCANVVFGVLFALAGLVLAGLPLAVWFYYDQNKDTIEPHTLGWLISSVVVGVTLPISVWEIVMHLRYMEVPLLQVPIIRILWMVPIYAVDSWLALRFSWTEYRTLSLYINTARECYEAFVVYNFLVFLARFVALSAEQERTRYNTPPNVDASSSSPHLTRPSSVGLASADSPPDNAGAAGGGGVERGGSAESAAGAAGSTGGGGGGPGGGGGGGRRSAASSVAGDVEAPSPLARSDSFFGRSEAARVDANLRRLLSTKAPVRHIAPLCWMRPWSMRATAHHTSCEFYRRVKAGVVQYIVLKLLSALAAFILKPLSLWGEGKLTPNTGFFWTAMVTNFSQAWAIYCLILFYKGLRHELSPMNPLGKFLAVKAIVFFSFWQSLVVAVLVKFGLLESSLYPIDSELSAATQDFLICVEMLLFAIVHHYVFSYREFLKPPDMDAESGDMVPEPSGDFTSNLRAMVDMDDLWNDTRGTLAPILPKKPYPVHRVPPPADRAGSRGSSRQGSVRGSRAGSTVDEVEAAPQSAQERGGGGGGGGEAGSGGRGKGGKGERDKGKGEGLREKLLPATVEAEVDELTDEQAAGAV